MSQIPVEGRSTGELPPSLPVRLGDLLDYATGAVISRTLVKGPAGTLTLFAFDAGQGLSEHTAPYDATVLVLDGVVTLVIGGKTVEARAGDAVRMPAGVPHSLHGKERFKMLLVMIRG